MSGELEQIAMSAIADLMRENAARDAALQSWAADLVEGYESGEIALNSSHVPSDEVLAGWRCELVYVGPWANNQVSKPPIAALRLIAPNTQAWRRARNLFDRLEFTAFGAGYDRPPHWGYSEVHVFLPRRSRS